MNTIKNKKVLFTLNIDNVIDIITNSSSELFVLKSDSKEIVTSLLESIYPDFTSEYREPIQYKDMDEDEFESCIHWLYGWSNEKGECEVFPGFTFDELFEESPYQYQWKGKEFVWKKGVLEENKARIIQAIDPNNHLWFLYSIDENPRWEMQEQLMQIGTRYHLG